MSQEEPLVVPYVPEEPARGFQPRTWSTFTFTAVAVFMLILGAWTGRFVGRAEMREFSQRSADRAFNVGRTSAEIVFLDQGKLDTDRTRIQRDIFFFGMKASELNLPDPHMLKRYGLKTIHEPEAQQQTAVAATTRSFVRAFTR